jgi:RNA polymerase sigma-70 factor (ECF subfamily)
LLRDRQLAEDVFQEVWIKVLKAIGSYRPRQVPFRGWLYRVASNAAVDRLRRDSRHVVEELDAPLAEEGRRRVDLLRSEDPSPERLADSTSLGRSLSRALATLNERQRIAVLLRHQQGLTYPEIASVLEVPEGTVKALVHRGVTAMREQLSEEWSDA